MCRVVALAPMDRRFRAACLVGALAATVVFGWVLFLGRVGLADERPAGDFYDAQARALFDGRWDLPPEVLSIEAFVVDGKTYTYFGPVPAILRMPVLAVTDEHARVLRPDGAPIPGLYAAGNVSAAVMGNTYAGPGATIGPAIVFGYLAAEDLAHHAG